MCSLLIDREYRYTKKEHTAAKINLSLSPLSFSLSLKSDCIYINIYINRTGITPVIHKQRYSTTSCHRVHQQKTVISIKKKSQWNGEHSIIIA